MRSVEVDQPLHSSKLEATMLPCFAPNHFSKVTLEQQIAKCREMSRAAENLAAIRGGENRQVYLHLARRWSELADEMQFADWPRRSTAK